MSLDDDFEKAMKNRPHVVLLGAGASVAAIPRGDKNGLKTSIMVGFLKKLGMQNEISGLNLKTNSDNLEDIYSEIAEQDQYAEIREKLDTRIRNYFSQFEIPDTPTIYDYLLISLRSKDLIATFNWDPLLLQAYQRVNKITSDLPDLAFLHGNVMVGYCLEHKCGGNINGNVCRDCHKPFSPSRLLYPIREKNYSEDPYTVDNWKALKSALKTAYRMTIFGYSAPKTDIEAIEILKEAWGSTNNRNLEDFEFIDIRPENEILESWQDFVHTHHYDYCQSFFESCLAKFPRRTTEELFDRTMNCHWLTPKNPINNSMTFSELKKLILPLLDEENTLSNNAYITLYD